MEVDGLTSEMSLDCSAEGTPQQALQECSQTSTSSKTASVSSTQAETTPRAGTDTSGNKVDVEKAGMTQLATRAPEASNQSDLHRVNDTSMSNQASSLQPATNMVPLLKTVMAEEESSSNTITNCSTGSISFKPLASVVSGSTATSSSFSSSSSSFSTTVISPSQPQTTESDPNKVVALKIIISDEQEQQGSDSDLNRAVSSIPTIFLSPPTKSLTKALPSTPGSSITPEETAQAVNSLQGAESAGDLVISGQNNLHLAQPRPMAPETGFIQLLPANPTFGVPSSYLVVADPSSGVDQHSSRLSGGSGEVSVCSTPQVVVTPPRSRAVVSIAPNVARPFSPGKSKNYRQQH